MIKRFTIALLLVVVGFAVSELVLRQFFGNLAVRELFDFNPGDGRCVALKPGASVEYTGHWLRTAPVTQEVNSQGFRGPSAPEARGSPSIRIAALGDSFVYGTGVVVGDTFSARMEELPRASPQSLPVEVLNFGVPGLNLDEVIRHYDVFARRWKPDIVLYFMWNNDLEAPFCDTTVGRLAGADPLLAFANRLVLLRIPYVLLHSFGGRGKREDPVVLRERLLVGLQSLADSVAADGASFGLVVLGDPIPVHERAAAGASMKERGIPMLDLAPLLANEENLLPRDTHLSPLGNRRVAEAVGAWVKTTLPGRPPKL